MTLEIRAISEMPALDGATVIGAVMEGGEPAPGSEELLATIDQRHLAIDEFEGKQGQKALIPHEQAQAALIVGLGDEVSFESLRDAAGSAIRKVRTDRAVSLLAAVGIEGATRAVTEGSLLGAYRYERYKTPDATKDSARCSNIELMGGDEGDLAEARLLCNATIQARDWVNTPAKDQSPAEYAAEIEQYANEAGVEVDIWDKAKIESEGLGAVLGVAAGSKRDPRVVILRYVPDDPVRHLAIVGKGITFDTGGLSLKTVALMGEMKDDMAGSAAAAAATVAMAQLGIPVEVTCVTPLTDNAVGGDATRPGDVLRPLEGPTIEVVNTDAEGRLILADGLGVAQRYSPGVIVDIATLTGAARVALGDKVAAVFSNEPDLAEKVLAAASTAGERFWEMPLVADYKKLLDSSIADMKNSPETRYGSAIAAALFLSEYAGLGPWAHLDIAGPARARETSGDQIKGGSGFGVRTLVELARALAEDT